MKIYWSAIYCLDSKLKKTNITTKSFEATTPNQNQKLLGYMTVTYRAYIMGGGGDVQIISNICNNALI